MGLSTANPTSWQCDALSVCALYIALVFAVDSNIAGTAVAQATAARSETSDVDLGCSTMVGLSQQPCELAQALLRRDCKLIESPRDKQTCADDLAVEKGNPQARLHDICFADWIPVIAKECAAERARIMRDRADAARRRPSETREAFGTAFFVLSDGTALTNSHVVGRCQQVRVSIERQQGTARVVARDEKNDLALLATNLQPIRASNWRLSVRQGEEIVVYGFPLTRLLASGGNVATGNVTALSGLGNDSRYLQISAPVQPGNSGGPLFDRYGNVVGIIVAKLNALSVASFTGDIPQNVNFAIKASIAAAFLDVQRVAAPTEIAKAEALSTADIAERARAS